MRTISVETPTHGLALIKDAAVSSSSRRLLVGFHGYAQSADDMLEELELVPGSERWTLLSVQGLHRFYRGDRRVVASWMTRQDRDLAIADNLAYVNRAVSAALGADVKDATLVFLGFSQGVAMAYRAGLMGDRPARAIVAVGGDVPPDVKGVAADRFPPILIAAGDSDEWYTAAKLKADEGFLREHGVRHDVFRYRGGHVFTPDVRHRIQRTLDDLTA